MARIPWTLVWGLVLIVHTIHVTQAEQSVQSEAAVQSDLAAARRALEEPIKTLTQLIDMVQSYRSDAEEFKKQWETKKFKWKNCILEFTETKKGRKFLLKLDDPACGEGLMSIASFMDEMFRSADREEDEESDFMTFCKKFNFKELMINTNKKGNTKITIKAASKESFKMFGEKVEVEEASLELRIQTGKSFSYENIYFEVKGKIAVKTNLKLDFEVNKGFGKVNGDFKMEMQKIKIKDLFAVFTADAEDDEDEDEEEVGEAEVAEVAEDAQTDAEKEEEKEEEKGFFDNISLQGSVDGKINIKGISTLNFEVMADDIAGATAAVKLTVIIQKGKKTKVGFHAEMTQMKPMVLANYILEQITGTDYTNYLKDVPIINDLTVNMDLQYGNTKGVSVKGVTGSIKRGLRIKFVLPLNQVVQANKLSVKAGTTLSPSILIKVSKKKLQFQTPKNQKLHMKNFLLAVAPVVAEWGLEQALDSIPGIEIKKFDVKIKQKLVDLEMKADDVFSVGDGFFKLEQALFKFKKTNNDITFTIHVQTRLAGGTIALTIKKDGNKYLFECYIQNINTANLLDTFAKHSTITGLLHNIQFFNFELTSLKVKAEIEGRQFKGFRVEEGRAKFLNWDAEFEAFVTKKGAKLEMAFGLIVQNCPMNSLTEKLLSKTGDSEKTSEYSWMSNVRIAFLLTSDREAQFTSQTFKTLLSESSFTSYGALFHASISVPNDCAEDGICLFIKEKMGLSELVLKGEMSPGQFILTAQVNGRIVLASEPEVVLIQGELELKIGIETGFAIGAKVEVTFEKKNKDPETVIFGAKLGFLATGILELEFTMEKMLTNVFGIEWLSFGNFKMEGGIQVPSMVPTRFGLKGEFRLGYNGELGATFAGKYDINGAVNFYVYVDIDPLTFGKIITAFRWETEDDIPQAVLDSGFPNGLSAGISLPGDNSITHGGQPVFLKKGFFLKGTINILGYEVACEIELDIPKRFYVKATFDTISVAGGMIEFCGYDVATEGGSTEGPVLVIEIQPADKKFDVYINAFVRIFTISIGADIRINNDGIQLTITGSFMGWFTATISVNATRATSLKDTDASTGAEWSFGLCVGSNEMEDMGKVTEETENALEEARVEVTKAEEEQTRERRENEEGNPNNENYDINRFPTKEEIRPGYILTTLDRLGSNFDISVEVYFNDWRTNVQRSILHFTKGGNNGQYGDRLPLMFIGGDKHLGVCFHTNGNTGFSETCKMIGEPALRRWHKIRLNQHKEDGQYKYRLFLNDNLMHQQVNTDPRNFTDVKVYTTSHTSWLATQDGYVRNLKVRADEPVSHYECKHVPGKGNGIERQMPGVGSDEDCVRTCGALKKGDDSWNGVRMYQLDKAGCWCQQYMDAVSGGGGEWRTCFLEKRENMAGPNLGKTSWGKWTNYVKCPFRKKIIGFNIKVEEAQGGVFSSGNNEDRGLTGIQLRCDYNSYKNDTSKLEVPNIGSWMTWKMCPSGEWITKLNVKGVTNAGSEDDFGAADAAAECSGGSHLQGGATATKGQAWGVWTGYEGCEDGYYFCGAKVSLDIGGSDPTGVNRIRMLCCADNEVEPDPEPIYKCALQDGAGNGDHYAPPNVIGEDACVMECGRLRRKYVEHHLNGIVLDADGTCTCKYMMNTIATHGSKKSCFLNPTTSWAASSTATVNKWYGAVQDTEADLLAEISFINSAKSEMSGSCVDACDAQNVKVGGIEIISCNIGGRQVNCPRWKEEMHEKPDPWCLASCYKSQNFISRIFSKLKGGIQLIYLKWLEAKMVIAKTIVDGLQGLVQFAETLTNFARRIKEEIGNIIERGKNFLSEIAAWVKKNLLDVRKLCIKASMAKWSDGLCFTFDADVYIGGTSGKHIEVTDEEMCFNGDWFIALGKKIARYAFPGLDDILSGWQAVKDIKKDSKQAEKSMQHENTNVDKKGKQYAEVEEDAVTKTKRSGIPPAPTIVDALLDDLPDELVVRDDGMIQSFRDIFSDDEEDDDDAENASEKDSEVQPNSNFVLEKGVQFDAASLANSTNANLCKRTQDVMNVYAGTADSINFLANKSEEVKTEYTKFVTDMSNKFIYMEAEIRNKSINEDWDADEEEDAMFYVNKAKRGIAKWKENYDRTYSAIDQSNLQSWRGYMGEVVAGQQMDVASFLNTLSTASKDTAKRMEVPTNSNLESSLTTAEQVMRNLLSNEAGTLSSKKSSVGELMNAVNNMRDIAKNNKCFESGLLQAE